MLKQNIAFRKGSAHLLQLRNLVHIIHGGQVLLGNLGESSCIETLPKRHSPTIWHTMSEPAVAALINARGMLFA